MRSALLLADSVRVALYAAFSCASVVLAAPGRLDARESFALMSSGPAARLVIGSAALELRSRTTGSSASHSLDSASRIVPVTDFSLAGHTLTRHGRSSFGLVMVGAARPCGMVGAAAAPPRRPRANGATVTLWDEIAPPLPLPIPAAAAHAGEGSAANYRRE